MADSKDFDVLYESSQTKVVRTRSSTIVWYGLSIDMFGNKFWITIRTVDNPVEYASQCEVFKVKP